MSHIIYHLAHASSLLYLLQNQIEMPDTAAPHGNETLCGALCRAANTELEEALGILAEMQEGA